jgi:hypothetical protein
MVGEWVPKLVFVGLWCIGLLVVYVEANRGVNKQASELEITLRRQAEPATAAWLRRELRRQRVWIGVGVITGCTIAGYVNLFIEDFTVWEVVCVVFGVVTGGVIGHALSAACMQPLAEGSVRSATLRPRRLADYLTPRERWSNMAALVEVGVAGVLALLIVVVDGLSGGVLVAAIAVTAWVLVLVAIGVQRWLVARPRTAESEEDLFWQEHVFARQLRLLPRGVRTVGEVTVVAAAVVILSQESPDWLRVGAVAAVVALAVTWFVLLADDRDPAPRALRELEAPV